MIKCLDSSVINSNELQSPQCQYFVLRKKRLCRMTVRPGRQFCGEHEPEPNLENNQVDTRIPCPNDPKHTCYASKLQKHLSICNARAVAQPAYIVPGLNAPPPGPRSVRPLLSEVPAHLLQDLIQKVNLLYEQYINDSISAVPERPIHPLVLEEYSQDERTESSLRHLRQASSLLWLAEDEGLVRDRTCYVELGAGKGHLSYYAWRAWCARASRGSRVLLVDRASLRHKRDNKLRGANYQPTSDGSPESEAPETELEGPTVEGPTRLRADLADLALHAVPVVQECDSVVGFAKHLCGVATDYALRCVTAPGLGVRTRGLVLATCCHHRCSKEAFVGTEHLAEMGISESELDIMFGIVSWATCGDGRSRESRLQGDDARDTQQQVVSDEPSPRAGPPKLDPPSRAMVGLRAKALLDRARAQWLQARGFRVRLVRYVPAAASPENLAILANRDDH